MIESECENMYCKKCGADILKQAKFCPKCGTVVTVNILKKKKLHKIVALITSLTLLIVAFSGIFVFRDKIISFTFGEKDAYLKVDEVLQEKIVCEEFKNASFDDRKEIASEVLSNLEKDGKIKNNSVTYSEDGCFYFNFIDGGEGLISLCDASDETEGYETGEYKIREGYKMFHEMEYFVQDDQIYSEIEKNDCKYSDSDLTAVIIDCLGETGDEIVFNDDASIRDFIKKDAKAWTANTMKTDYCYECTVDKFKTILCGYDFIDIRCHGIIDEDGNPAISLQEKDGMFDQKYMDDVHAGRVGRAYGAFGGKYYMKNSFFSYYYNGKLNSAIVWLGCCSGYKSLFSIFSSREKGGII